jgi:uncharacterized protein YndB with AHSA1/START domain
MPRVSRSRVIAADRGRIWELVADPHNLPRWWPRTKRVEDVRGPTGARAHWTAVLETDGGKGVRADYRCTGATMPQRYEWEQQVEGTPFERVFRAARLEIGLSDAEAGTAVTLTSVESLRGISKLGSTMMRGAARDRLDEALASIERVLVP